MFVRFWFAPQRRTWGKRSALQAKKDYSVKLCPLQNRIVFVSHSPILTQDLLISQKFPPERHAIRMKLKTATCMMHLRYRRSGSCKMHATNRRMPTELVMVTVVFGLICVTEKASLRNVLLVWSLAAGKRISSAHFEQGYAGMSSVQFS